MRMDMENNVETYLTELAKCEISRNNTPGSPYDGLQLNGMFLHDYSTTMDALYDAFRVSLCASVGSLQIADFAKISKVLDVCSKNVRQLEVGCAVGKTPFLRAALDDYTRQVERCSALVEDVKLFKLGQGQASSPVVITKPDTASPVQPDEEMQVEPVEDPRKAEPKQPRRNFNETNTSHPGEYWGYKEMEKGEGIAHSTAWNIVKNPYYLPAIRFVGRNLRVNIAKLHELQQKAAAEKHKPIGDHPKRKK